MKIIIVQKIFSHYRKPLFDNIDKIFDLTLISTNYSHSVSLTNVPEPNYRKNVSFIKYGKNETNFILDSISPLFKYKPNVIIYEFSLGVLSLIPTLLLARLLKIKFILHGHGYNFKNGFNPNKSILDKIRLWLIRNTDATILYSNSAKRKLSNHVSDKKLFVAPNTLNTNYLTSLKNKFEKIGKKNIKKDLKFSKKYNLIFIGRLLESKNPHYCIDVIQEYIKKYNDDIMFHFVGDGPLESKLIALTNEKKLNNNISFYGKIHDDELSGKLLYCSDLMVMPGALGLSINHAFCFGCPVVSFSQKKDGPFHSPEVEYIVNNKTGFLAQDFDEFKDFIFNYLKNSDKQSLFKKEIEYCINYICSIENMIDGFKNAVFYTMKK